MSFGRIPDNAGQTPQYGQPYAQPRQYQQQYQSPYGQPAQPYAQQQPQYAQSAAGMGAGAGAAAIDATAAYSYEKAQRVSITRAYGEMTIGLAITAVVAVLTQTTGALAAFLTATGTFGWIGLAIVQVALAVYLGARIMKISPATARAMFYVYAALMGFTLSSIFMAYDLADIGVCLALCAGFFFALTMLGLTTKFDMLKAGPILFVGLIMLVVSQLVVAFFFPSNGALQIIAAIGIILFAGMTVYDAQATRAIFREYQNDGPEMIKKVSIVCALNLYLDFVNMFLYLLQLFGNRD